MKKCTKCLSIKPFSNFSKRSSAPDGFEYKCKSCKSNKKISLIKNIPNKKRCNKCFEYKDFICFSKRSASKDGLNLYCGSCESKKKVSLKKKYRYKSCAGCKIEKAFDFFHNNRAAKDGKNNYCVDCRSQDTHPKQRILNNTKYCTKCKTYLSFENFSANSKGINGLNYCCKICSKDSSLKSQYNITSIDYRNMLEKQNNNCGSCGKHYLLFKKSFDIDHDHSCCNGPFSCGKCIRGLLCSNCNRGIGLLGDTKESIQNALAYFNNYS